MTVGLILAAGLVAGVDWRLVALAGGSVLLPVPAGVAVGAAGVIARRARRREMAGAEVRFAETVLGELRSGSSLRLALGSACSLRADCIGILRRLEVGEPLDLCLEGLSELLPTIGGLVESAVAAGAGGGRMAPVFEELVSIATSEESALSELASATAQVRASMWILVGGPVGYLAVMAASGRFQRLLSVPGSSVVASVGAGLFLAGTISLALMGRKSR